MIVKLDYGTLLSFDPLQMPYGFSIISPTLKEVSKLGFGVYGYYLSILTLDIEAYYRTIDNTDFNYFNSFSTEEKNIILQIRNDYNNIPEPDRQNIMAIAVYSYDKLIMEKISDALSFFTDTCFKFSRENDAFVSVVDEKIMSKLELKYFDEIVDMILQRNGINKPQKVAKPKFKNKTAEKLYYRTLEAENKKKKYSDLELPNIISSVAARHNSLNIINIWDITIYQLYDQFQRLQNNCIYDINAMSVSAWGDKDNKFDQTMWYKKINTQN